MIWLKKAALHSGIVILLLLSVKTWAWSFYGHAQMTKHVVGQLPVEQQKYYGVLAALLDKQGQADIALLGTWADQVRDETITAVFANTRQPIPSALQSVQQYSTTRWHYVNFFLPAQTSTKDCRAANSGQLLLMLDTLHHILFDRKITLTPQQEAIIIAFQIHLLQDLHQPLHTFAHLDNDCEHDRGGNNVCLRREGKCTLNLHQYWDDGFGLFATLVQQTVDAPSFAFEPENWARHNLALADDVYASARADSTAKYFTPDYVKRARAIVQKQIQLAQSRTLAYLKYYYNLKVQQTSKVPREASQ